MSVNQVDKQTGDTSRIAGGTLYADAPIGAILAFGGATAPAGWMICNGAAVSRTTYAALFAAIGTAFGAGDGSTTFNIPDLREATTKGAGETGQTVGAHVKSGGLAVGEFIDDRVEKHTHFKTRAIYASSGVYEAISENGSTDPTNDNQYNTGRSGDTTEVKAVGVNYIIKAQQVALPADFATELDKKQNITDNTLETDSKTVPGAINEINTALSDELIATGSGTTYAAQLSSLKTSFDNLTYDQKKCAYLKLANVVANVNNIVGIFGYFGLGATDGNFNSLRLNDSKYYSMAVSNGVITHNDYSSRNISEDITGNIELHVIH